MYLSAGFSSVRVREKALGQASSQKADSSRGGRDGGQPPGEECEAAHIRAAGRGWNDFVASGSVGVIFGIEMKCEGR